jgi:hypothetical protein
MMSDLLTVAQVAALLNCSPETVTRRFAREKGVIDLSTAGNSKRRRYRVLRVPRQIVEKYVATRGGRITVDPPTPKPSRAKKIAPTEDQLTHDLAQLASEHGSAARRTVERISRRAKAMSYVPVEDWERMVFFDDPEDD